MRSRPRSAATPSRQVLQGEQRYDLVVRYQAPYRDTREAIENIRLCLPPASASRLRSSAISESRTAPRKSIAKANSALRRDQIQRARPRPGQHRRRSHAKRSTRRSNSPSAITSTGPANTRAKSAPSAAAARCADHHPDDFHHSLHHVPFVQMGLLILANVAMAPIGGLLALLITGTQFQCFFGRRFSGAVRRVGADRRHHA